jgi:hypothetical protein
VQTYALLPAKSGWSEGGVRPFHQVRWLEQLLFSPWLSKILYMACSAVRSVSDKGARLEIYGDTYI